MLEVGITGGIGSGKTTICNLFASLGVSIYSSDSRAKWLMNNQLELKRAVENLFGLNSYKNGKLNRQFVAYQVFKNKGKLEALNQLVHPAVANDYGSWLSQQSGAYILKEAAILYESGSYKNCDKVIVVYAPDKLRIERVTKRDAISSEEVRHRMDNQWPQQQKMDLADYVVYNDEEHAVIPQVLAIHQSLSKS